MNEPLEENVKRSIKSAPAHIPSHYIDLTTYAFSRTAILVAMKAGFAPVFSQYIGTQIVLTVTSSVGQDVESIYVSTSR